MRRAALPIALSLPLILAACGGGGGGSAGSFQPIAGAADTSTAPQVESAPQADPKAQEPTASNKACHVILYGDSIMRGEPLVQEGPQRRMQRLRPSWTVELRAVAGQTGFEGAQKYLHDARPTGAVVALQWGMNDATFGTSVAPMRPMVEQIKAEGSRPVLTGPSPRSDMFAQWLAVRSAIQAMASDTQTPFVDWGSQMLPTLDNVHPTQASSDTLTDRLIATIEQECQK